MIGLETFLPCTTLLKVLRAMKYSYPKLHLIGLRYTMNGSVKSLFWIFVTTLLWTFSGWAQKSWEKPILTGAERINKYMDCLEGIKVGVTTNHTALVAGRHLLEVFLERGVNVTSVFSPEHGFQGLADAGEHVESKLDSAKSIHYISLYGEKKKPLPEDLLGLDVMVFDMQDVGVRFYTYISTLHYVMEACAESRIPVIVLDRPNPNGHYVDGPVLDTSFRSFVGMHPVPIVHGMTIGEYAQMINEEAWLKNGVQCDLTVIRCKHYNHQRPYSLPVPPSPNLRSDRAIALYPSLCLLEATTVSVGRGTDQPFEHFGHYDFPDTGYQFIPVSGPGSKDPKLKDSICNAINLQDANSDRVTQFSLDYLILSRDYLEGKVFIDRPKFFNLLAGNAILQEQLITCVDPELIRESWQEDLKTFKHMRRKYLLYD